MMTCGKLIMPVRWTSSCRPAASRARLISVYSTPRASSSCLTRVQNEQGSVVYTTTSLAAMDFEGSVAGSLKTEAIVLRTLRFGEADRILHLYTPHRGRVSAIAKGVRRSRSRFGGRLEPFFRLNLVLYEGRSDLLTVTSAETVDAARARCARDGRRARRAPPARADAVGRLFETGEPNPAVFHLLANELALLDARPARARRRRPTSSRSASSSCSPPASRRSSAGCAVCGEREHLSGFSGAAGGVVCGACEGSAFPLGEEAHAFMVEALGRPLAEAPADAGELALRQAERAILETVEHHAHLRLRPALTR